MLYTRKGDSGTTRVFNSKSGKRVPKSSCQIESLGALDELNSFLGLAKVKSVGVTWSLDGRKLAEVVAWTQNCLFTVQAEIAGSDKRIGRDKVNELEKITDSIEKELPPIKTFFISGGTELAVLFDVSRTLARKAERRVIGGIEEEGLKINPTTLAFLNRLSSLFYALARLTNYKSGITEESPSY